MKQTQRQLVIQHLKENGSISRNYCLQHYVSRLGAIVCLLKSEGYDFETKDVGGDYVYTLTASPKVRTLYVKHPLTGQVLTTDAYARL